MGRRTLLLIVACTALVAVAASSAAADPIPITVTPPTDFGSVLEGQASTPQTLTIQNTGAAAITLNQLTLAGTDPGSFSIPAADDACSNATLNSGDTCDFNVVFNPPSGAGERGVQTSLIDVGDTAGDDAQEVDFSGTAVAPQIDVPASLPFGSVQLGQSSSQIVTVQNDGQGELDVTTPASPGGDFTVSPTGTTCTGAGAQLTPGDSCNVNVVFTPSATGDENATLVVPSNDPDTPSAQVPVSGTGTQGAVTFDPTSLTFTTHLGTTSPSQTISVQNTGTAPLTIAGPGNGVKINGTNQSNFAVTGDGCTSQTLQVGDSCDVSISFTTTVMAQRTANLQIKDDGAGGTQLAPLSGTGIQSGPVTVTPTSNNFGSVAEGSSSSAQTFTFTNTGGDTVTFPNAPGTFSLTGTNPGDFSTANDGCSGQTIGAGDTCSVDVTFSPPVGAGVRGARSATLSVTGGFVNSPLTVKLTGTATAPAISVPSTVNFGNVAVGGQPGQQTVTVKNNGAGTLTIGQIGAPSGAGFSIVTDGCSNTGLTAGQTCSVVLQFQPSSTGAATGTLQIPHNDPDTTNPVSISLTANGTQVGPVTISPTSATFGSVVEGSSSLPKTFTVTNTGTAPLTGLSVGLGGSGQSNFTITTDNCSPSGTTVNPGKSCTFKVEFTPAQGAGVRGPQTATVTVSGPTNASGLPQSLGLSGTATAPTISLPASYDFGNVPIGQTATHAITVKNTGSGTLDVTGQKITSPGFSVSTDGCAAPTGLLAAGDSCTITVQFQSTEVGTASGTLSVPNNDPDAAHPAQVSLSATGTMAGPVTVTPGTKTFSSQVEGTTSAAQTFTVTNTGTAPVALGPPPVVSLGGASPGSFTLSGNTCASLTQLGAAKSCVFKVAFSPPVAAGTRGAQNASVTVNGGADLPQTVPLSGTATSPTLSIPNSVGFGSTLVGTPVSNKVTISNTGTGTLNVAFQNITGAGFSVGTNGCAGTAGNLTAGKSCSITVVFNPSSPGAASGTLKVTDNDPDSPNPASVSLTGTGTQIGPVTLGPGSNNFGSQLEGTQLEPADVHRHEHRHGHADRRQGLAGRRQRRQLRAQERQLHRRPRHGWRRLHLPGCLLTAGWGRRPWHSQRQRLGDGQRTKHARAVDADRPRDRPADRRAGQRRRLRQRAGRHHRPAAGRGHQHRPGNAGGRRGEHDGQRLLGGEQRLRRRQRNAEREPELQHHGRLPVDQPGIGDRRAAGLEQRSGRLRHDAGDPDRHRHPAVRQHHRQHGLQHRRGNHQQPAGDHRAQHGQRTPQDHHGLAGRGEPDIVREVQRRLFEPVGGSREHVRHQRHLHCQRQQPQVRHPGRRRQRTG